ncbi:MAG TPA: S1-like domain-containing RNA-binding protein [Luteibaculaceae bacterium]|nr:S1-like domain-containing RNA-binding protein [Luteibaculaceae bacterium]
MILGAYNELEVLRFTSVGAFLGNEHAEVLLPNKYLPEHLSVGSKINVFVYTDSDDRPIATTLKPLAVAGSFASLRVKDLGPAGAFLDVGLEKDILVPYREQKTEMQVGYWYIVFVYLDEKTNRLAATTKIKSRLQPANEGDLVEGQAVELLIGERSDLGYSCIIDQRFLGLIYHNELFRPIKMGQMVRGYVKKLRTDGKVDVRLEASGYENIDQYTQALLEALERHQGFLALTDHSDPEEIRLLLGMSKKNFKKSLGALYKQKIVILESAGIRLVKSA